MELRGRSGVSPCSMASGTYRNGGAAKAASKAERPPSSQFATPKPASKSRVSSAAGGSGVRRSGSLSGGSRNDPGGTSSSLSLFSVALFLSPLASWALMSCEI